MDKGQLAATLDEIGTFLELHGENPFRCQAYFKAARAIEQLEANLADVVAGGKLADIPGIGATLAEKITVLVTTGRLEFYDALKKKTPPGLVEMLRLPGVGPKKIKSLYDQLGIDDLNKLKEACAQDRVAALKGFGVKTQQKILEGIAYLGRMGDRVRIDHALRLADTLVSALREAPGIIRMEVCGSLRRRRETIRDIDILISSDTPAPIMQAFVNLPQVVQMVGRGETKSSVMVTVEGGPAKALMNADLRVVSDQQFPFALNYFTGSKEHNVALRQRAQQYGLKLNEYGLVPTSEPEAEIKGPAATKKSIPCKDEPDIYRALDLDYVEPEMRENTGEIDAAAQHRLPRLIELTDLQGTFHCHTTWSDGTASLEEMALAARELGLKYLGFADHSQSLVVANGLTPERVRQQHQAIDDLNRRLTGIKLLKGTECDILPDGRLDFDDETLAAFDYVVASVHTVFNLSEAEMTQRIIQAISHPRVTMLGHSTGRLLLRRDGYKVDLEAVLKAAAAHGKMIEINAHPQRLDLDWIHCKRAKALGVKLVINPDAHSMKDISHLIHGVYVARRGWLERGDVSNTLSAEEIAKTFVGLKA